MLSAELVNKDRFRIMTEEIKKIVVEVVEEANKKAKEIIEEAEKEKERILFEAKKEAEIKKEEIQKEAEITLERLETIEMTKARMNSKEIIQKTKMRLIENIYHEFYSEIDKEKTLKTMHELAKKHIKEIGTVYVSENDFDVAEKIFSNVKKGNIKGGLVVENKDGKESINLSMEIIDEIFRSRTFPKVYEMLFKAVE